MWPASRRRMRPSLWRRPQHSGECTRHPAVAVARGGCQASPARRVRRAVSDSRGSQMEAAGAGEAILVARTRTPTRPCGAARRGASVAQLDAARLDAARRARSPQMPEKKPNGSSRSRRRKFGRANAHADAAVRRSPTRRVRRAARRSATRCRAPREVAADAEEADHRRGSRRPPEQKDVFREGAAGGFEPAPLIEDACLEPLHHPGKLALLDRGEAFRVFRS